MTKTHYSDESVTFRPFSVLPLAAEDALRGLGTDLFEYSVAQSRIAAIRQSLTNVDPWSFRRAQSQISRCAGLSSWPRYPYLSKKPLAQLFKRYEVSPKRAREQNATFNQNVMSIPDLAYVLIYDRYGHVREAAIRSMNGPLCSPFEVLALFDLMNNWVPEVRDAALEAVPRVLPLTNPKVLSVAIEALFGFMPQWKRWNKSKAHTAIENLVNKDVIVEMVSRLNKGLSRRSVALYSFLQRLCSVDAYHQNIFDHAGQSHLRAMALNTILRQRAKWVVGYKRAPVDKVFNQYKILKVYDRRTVLFDNGQRLNSLTRALRDKSALVRSTAAQFLIDFPNDLSVDAIAAARQLSADRSQKVSSRGDFLLRQLTNTSADS